jgi:hypothetical protein
MTMLTRSDNPALLLQRLIERDGRQSVVCRLRASLQERDPRVFVLRFDADAGVWWAGLRADPAPIKHGYIGFVVLASAIRGAGRPVQHGCDTPDAARKAVARALVVLGSSVPALAGVLLGRVSVGKCGAIYRRRPVDPQILT